MLFLKVFKVGDNLDSKLRQFHIFASLYEKHFWPFADFRMGISKSDLVLRNSLLYQQIINYDKIENIDRFMIMKMNFPPNKRPLLGPCCNDYFTLANRELQHMVNS